jgi:hypothetical protein
MHCPAEVGFSCLPLSCLTRSEPAQGRSRSSSSPFLPAYRTHRTNARVLIGVGELPEVGLLIGSIVTWTVEAKFLSML